MHCTTHNNNLFLDSRVSVLCSNKFIDEALFVGRTAFGDREVVNISSTTDSCLYMLQYLYTLAKQDCM